MALKITKASDPITVEQIVSCIYAPPGVGKSSLGFSAEAPILLDFDQGAHRAINRKDTVQIAHWNDVESMTAADLSPYKTVIVDTAGRALDVLSVAIIDANPKHGRGGSLTLQGYGELKARFTAWTKLIRSFGKDIVLIAHSDEQRKGDEVMERLDVQGGSKAEIYKVADAMARLSIVGGKRVLNFNPTDTAFGKNPAQLPPLEVPDFRTNPNPTFLGEVIGQIKTKLNESSAEAVKEQARVTELRDYFMTLDSQDELNAKANDLAEAKASAKDKALLLSVAETKGYIYDKKAKAFVLKPAKAA